MRVKDSIYKYVVVLSRYYKKYGIRAFIEPLYQTDDINQARQYKASLERCDQEEYTIVRL